MSTPELRDVPGPSALGGGWRRSAELLYVIAVNDFKKTYFGTALGYIWSLARPLMLFGVLLAVFTQVFRVGSQVPHYPVLLLFNIVLFGFFQEATVMAVSSIVSQEGVVRKTQFPRLVIPLAVVLTAFFNLVLNLVVVFIFVLAFGVTPMWTWLLFPVVLGLLITASPTRISLRAISSALCNVARAIVEPASGTGRKCATGVATPVRPTWISIASSTVCACSAENL